MTRFTISAHGVRLEPNGLSRMQEALRASNRPIRIAGAPTGSGKTYTFLKAAAEGQFVILVVPTQALAADVEKDAAAHAVRHARWDAIRAEGLRASGQNVWDVRGGQVEEMTRLGGLLVTTPESLAQVLHGVPVLSRSALSVNHLRQARHIVFDEAHTLTERGFGFLTFWLTLAAYRYVTSRETSPAVTLLSATHSDLFDGWLLEQDPEAMRDCVEYIDETISNEASGPVRWLHGDVDISVADHPLLDMLLANADVVANGRTLMVYDSIRDLAQDLPRINQALGSFHLGREQVYVVDGQDRQVDRTVDEAKFPSGPTPGSEHRLIIGTSAVEMGVNYPGLTAGFLDPGPDAAALLQRIGRISRGGPETRGRVWVSASIHGRALPSHVLRLTQFEGRVEIDQVRGAMRPMRLLAMERARALGEAYWSYLGTPSAPGHLQEFLNPAHQALSQSDNRPGALLNSIRAAVASRLSRHTPTLKQWLIGVDRELASIRDFNPTVVVQFDNAPIITYDRFWIERNIDCSRLHIGQDGVWHFPKPRNLMLRDKPTTVGVQIFHPFSGWRLIHVGPGLPPPALQIARDPYPVLTSPHDKDLWNRIRAFTLTSQLVVYRNDQAYTNATASTVV